MPTSNNPRHGEPIANVRQSKLPGGGLQSFPTPQFQEFIDEISSLFNDSTTQSVEQPRTDPLILALLDRLQAQVGSGNFLTSDETGFTVDSDRLSVDMDEA